MLNIMIIDGYVRTKPRIIVKDENNSALKFQLGTLNLASKNPTKRYMWVDVIAFGSREGIEKLSTLIEEDDFGTAMGSYSYQKAGNRYYAQLVLKKWDKKFSKGNVPTKETVDIDDNPLEEVKEIDW